MRLVDRCPCCDSDAAETHPALVAPFVAERAFLSAPFLCDYRICAGCGHRYFDLQIDPEEAARLYADYRGPSYFLQRHRHEWWYSKRINEGLGHAPATVRRRQAALAAFFRAHLDVRAVASVLDYGGDEGQFIPAEFGWQRYVHDLSGLPPVPGVTALATEDELRAHAYDLVLLCHVLEHVSDPAGVLTRIAGLPHAARQTLYVEVPCELPDVRRLMPPGRSRRYLEWLLHHRTLLNGADFLSTGWRIVLKALPPFGFPKLHEHVQQYTEASLARLVERCGYRVLHLERFTTVSPAGQGLVIGCLAEGAA